MHWKRILGIVAIVIVGLLVAIYAIVASYDFNKLKPTITKAAKDATGRELTIDGDIRLKFGFTPALFVENISLQNAPWGSRRELAKIKRFELRVALFPLIFGKVEVKRLILMEPDILIETDKTGQSNLKFEPAKIEDLEKKPAQGKKEEPKGKLPALLVDELRIEKGRLVYRDGITGKEYGALLETLAVSSASWESPVQLELKGSFNNVPIEVSGTLGPLIDLVNPGKAWTLKLTAKAAGADVKIDGKVQDPAAFRGLEINFSGQGKELENLQPLIGQPLPVRGPFDISGTVTDPAPKVYKISNLRVKLGESDMKGTVDLNLSSQRPALSFEGSSDKLDLRPLLPGGGKEEKKEEKAKIDEKGKKEEKSSPQKTGKQGKVFSSDPLPLAALKAIDAVVKFQAKQVQVPNLSMNDLDLDMTLREGNFDGKKIKAGIGGGTLDGHVTLDTRGKVPAMTALMKLDQLEISRILKESKSPDILEGKIDVDLDVMGHGESIAALMGGLNGKIAVVMGRGKINNKYLEMLGGDLGPSLFRLLNPAKEKGDSSLVNCLVVGFLLKDGLARTSALVLDTNYATAVGEGEINLKSETLGIGIKPVPKKGISTETAKLGLSPADLAAPFKLGGTLAHPSLALDTTQTAATVGKAVNALLSGRAGTASPPAEGKVAEENPCLAAIDAARKGKVPEGTKEKGTKEASKEDLIGTAGKTLQKLFGK